MREGGDGKATSAPGGRGEVVERPQRNQPDVPWCVHSRKLFSSQPKISEEIVNVTNKDMVLRRSTTIENGGPAL